ncbi:MAG: flagellar biosynthetic protein FliO [Candidatus Zixiibacteriota bacterium]|nr:MAG: flagellar biosynthetic protein FliO [candidate division Zixibacteria bacterium]
MEKSLKVKRRSQLTIIIIVLAALIGVLAINTDRATAVKAGSAKPPSMTETAAGIETDNNQSTGFYSSAAPSLLKLASALAIVVACIYVGIYLLKRLMGRKYSGNRQNNLLEVLETTYVAPKKSVSLLRVADKAVLVGMSENHITVLTELDAAQTREVLAAIEPERETESFRNVLKTATDKIKEFGFKRSKKTALET